MLIRQQDWNSGGVRCVWSENRPPGAIKKNPAFVPAKIRNLIRKSAFWTLAGQRQVWPNSFLARNR